jgi:hypothetical protein
MSKTHSGISRAAHETAAYMTADIRHSALEHGWHPDVVDNMHVHYDGKKFHVKIAESHAEQAFKHEYGDGVNPPTAVLRKYSNRAEVPSQVLYSRIAEHLKGIF